jgi:hypothetical protein
VLKATEDLAEMVRVREPTGIGDPLKWRMAVKQHSRSFMNPDLGSKMRRCQTGPVAKEVTEVGAAHSIFGGQRVDVSRA